VTLEWAEVRLLTRLGGGELRAHRPPGKLVLTRGLRRLLDHLATEAILADERRQHGRLPPRLAALLAQALVAQDKMDEADRYAGLAAELADEDDSTSQALWRIARARVRAWQGRPDEAIELAEAAVKLMTGTAAIDLLGDVHAAYGALLIALGRGRDAGVQMQAALDLYARKGDQAAIDLLRPRLAEAIG